RGLDGESSFEPYPLFTRINTRFTGEQIFAEEASEADLEQIMRGMETLLENVAAILFLSRIPGPLGRHFIRRHDMKLARFHTFLDGVITKLGARSDFISTEARSRPDRRLLVEEVGTLFMAGVEASATTATWALYELSRHPEIQQACRNEIRDAVGDRRLRAEDLRSLRTVIDVVREALRLYPPVPLLNRRPTRPVELGGYDFKPEDELAVATVLIQRHPEVWPEPHRFKPERWRALGPNPRGWIPFSAGPRNCIGEDLGLIESAILLSLILQRFEVLPDPTTAVLAERPKFKIVLQPREGFRLRLEPI
ncbi:MAG: cytochrome P450, partial [Acidobacteriota bacterium]